MGQHFLRDVLAEPERYQPYWGIYFVKGAVLTLQQAVEVSESSPAGFDGLLLMQQVQEIVEGHEEELGRRLTLEERLRTVLFYAEHDAYMDARELTRSRRE